MSFVWILNKDVRDIKEKSVLKTAFGCSQKLSDRNFVWNIMTEEAKVVKVKHFNTFIPFEIGVFLAIFK